MKRPRSFWRRRSARVAAALAITAAIALAVPFVFTTALVRYYFNHSNYAQFKITLDSATLGPTGRLTLHNLLVHDIREHAGKTLLSVSSARIDFAWTQLSQNHIRLIDVDGLQLYLRAADDQPLSLLRLAASAGAASPAPATVSGPPASPAPPTSAAPPFWFDELVVAGAAHVEGFADCTQFLPESMKSGIPLKLHARSTGNIRHPTRELALVLGDPEAADTAPALAARIALQPDPDGDIDIAISNISLRRASATLAPEVIAKLLPQFAAAPADLRRRYDVSLDAIQITGMLETGTDMRFTGDIDLRGLDAVARSEGTPLSLDSFALSAHIVAPLNDRFQKDILISGGTFSFDVLQGGPWRLSRLTANFELADQVFTLPQWQATFADGVMAGSLEWPLDNPGPTRGSVSVRDASAARILSHLPEELRSRIPLTVDGGISGKLTLSEEDQQLPSGRIDISTDDNFRLECPHLPALGPIVLKNAVLSGELSWPDKLWGMPEVNRGSIRADALTVAALDITDLSGDLLLNNGNLVLDAMHATLGADGTLAAAGRLNTATWTPDAVSLSATGIPAAAANGWLPADVQLDGALALTASLEHPDNAPKDYVFSATLGLSDPCTFHVHGGKATAAGGLTLGITGNVGSDLQTNLAATVKLAHLKSLTFDEALLALCLPAKTPAFKGDADIGLDTLSLAGKLAANPPAFSGDLDVAGLSAHATLANGSTLEIENLALSGPLETPLTFTTAQDLLAHIKASPAILAFDTLAYGKNDINDFAARLVLDQGRLTVGPDAECAFAGGAATGAAELDLLRPALISAALKLKQIDQAVISRNMLPERFFAEGLVDADIAFTRDPHDHLVGSIDLASVNPGRLQLDRDLSEKLFAPAAKTAALDAGNVLPPSFYQIVIGQLANYPYVVGKLGARDSGGELELTPNYTRVPLTPGEPGYAIKMKVEGHDVVYSYPVQIKGLTLAIPEQSVLGILAMGGGFASLISERHAPPASATRPAAATAPATAPATIPATAPSPVPATAPADLPATQPATLPAPSAPRTSATNPAATAPAAPRASTRPRG